VPLNMPRPYRPTKSGEYYIRKTVPVALRPLLRGKTAFIRSLRTKDPEVAKRRAPIALAEIDAILGAARLGQQCRFEDLKALAGAYFRKRSTELAEAARREGWDRSAFEGADASHESVLDGRSGWDDAPEQWEDGNSAEEVAAVRWAQPKVAALTAEHQLPLRPELQRQLAILLYRAEGQAITAARASYECWDSYDSPDYPDVSPLEMRSLPRLFEAYAQDRAIRSSTHKDWASLVKHFDSFMGGTGPDKVTRKDVRRYADHLRDKGGSSGKPLSANRINQGYLAALRATFAWAIEHEYLSANPAEKVSVRVPSEATRAPKRGYTNEELGAILEAARAEETAFKRWVPWLCAFTGARVSEILNARRAHVDQTEGVWFLKFRADTQSNADGAIVTSQLKTRSSFRCVPLHAALLQEGFLDYLATVPREDYLFPGAWRDQHGNRTKGVANQLRRWVHTVVPTSDELSPTHSFRHWFTSQARRTGMDGDVRRQITGHSYTDVHGRYGPADIPMLADALNKIESPLPIPDGRGWVQG